MRADVRRWIVGCAVGAAMTAGAWAATPGHPDSSKWPALFAADLSDADASKDVWSFKDGVLTATKDECIWTKREYENFILDLEFKNDEAANSGIVAYCTDKKNWIPNSVEIQILDDAAKKWADAPPTWRCGGIFGHLAPTRSAVRKAGEWNRMTVTCKGPSVTVVLNGETVAGMDMKKWTSATKNPDGSEIPPWLSRPFAELATKGFIGLQGKHGDAQIFFRNVRIKAID